MRADSTPGGGRFTAETPRARRIEERRLRIEDRGWSIEDGD
jgi:hypothetical protein